MAHPMPPVVRIVRDDGLGEDNPTFLVDGLRWALAYGGLEGFDGITHTVSAQDYAQYDGSYLLSERSPSKDRTITMVSYLPRAEAKAEAESFFIPGRPYEVHVSWEGRERWCAGRQYALSCEVAPNGAAQKVTWTVLCLDPYLLSEDEKSFDVAEASGSRGFPFCSFASRVAPAPEAEEGGAGAAGPVEAHVAGFVVGSLSKRVRLVNAGHATAYPRFDVTATGEVERPVISVYDRAGSVVGTVGLDLTLKDGDELVIDFSSRPTTLELNGANVSHLVTRGSTLATGIEVGEFEIGWSARSGDAALHVTPSIRERYASI